MSVNTKKTASMTLLLLFGLVVFLAWAGTFSIDQTVRAQGQIIPSGRTQIIQAVDGGVLSELLVHEGQTVQSGEKLAILEKDRSHASYEESRAKVAAQQAAIARAKAEANEQPLSFSSDLKDFPEFTAAQTALYEQRKRSLQDELTTLQSSLKMAQEELKINESLLSTGDISRLEVMRSQRQVLELEGKIVSAKNKYLQEARQEVSKLKEELSSQRYKLEERKNVLEHTVLTTPVAGVVKYLKVNTIGGVLRAGDELMQISPTDGDMVLEVKINPVDVGQLKLGLPVSIKLDAFDYSIYGSVQGSLSYISSDTLSEQGSSGQTSTYYRAHVKLAQDALKQHPKLANVALKPGLTATVDIKTDSRTVLQYLLKPVVKPFSGALSER